MTYTLTTPLYYVNDKPHLGSAYTTLACDAQARFQRLKGEPVLFITGCDEHGLKIQRTAEASGVSPQAHCDQVSETYEKLWQRWTISNDRFIRTTDPRHRQIVEQFYRRVEASGDVVEGRQQGWYCVACEEFKDDALGAEDPECSIHRRPLEWRDELNLFFRLSRYQAQIEALVSQPGFIAPASRRREVENFVAQGLRDFSISRLHLPWGIPVPGHADHTFYVWFDALLGYITALLEPGDPADLDLAITRGWPAHVHVIGKDILRFHAVYWPAMLLSAGLEPPQQVFGHGFLTREGQKMGKSLGNVLDPAELLEHYGRDAVRWYLLRDITFGDDGDFQQQRFLDLVNNDLANTIGNLLNRTTSMARRWFDNAVPPVSAGFMADHPLAAAAATARELVLAGMERLDFRQAAEAALQLAIAANGYLNEQAPWSRIKQGDGRLQVADDLYVVLEASRHVALLLAPLLPDLCERMLKQLGQPPLSSGAAGTWLEQLRWGVLEEGLPLPQPEPVMARLEPGE
ncbi:methionine--tRNA ligase [Synechococcus sp. CS-602]|uniref:methionine--tRNA ligase n=1 Tax=Synechococcaceae TaxID=1890426 RepID=UPI0008FF28A8|nr:MULTISPECIES: methionine--tRNA ligase [Synechococcaceae]MCT4364212.1 methionine--tRNA ligase [Candidatus Regnicoccus frigidus MAG-AL1]APD48965.1 methionine--tRNA ligase [Synechococcus sp. SynAce01]MCT0204591.1 methionine--tRNA ligase [Synechococcus sp. CS-602]MCT0246351.1 methionine--tRNA ligase [Synechococcus sp. CS-601]MCT4366647.1 methionine--tRNA ligase [Candidatus Regnicoccus frigidus MAG-AL2]